MSKVHYAIISAEDHLREVAKKAMVEDYENFQQLLSSRSEGDLENFQFRIGNVLEVKGERIVCDLFEEEEFNKISGMNIWGYITHMFGSGLFIVDVFYLHAAEQAVSELADNMLVTVPFEIDASSRNCDILGEMQITVEFDEDNNTWAGLGEVEDFLQEFQKTVKSNVAVKKIIDKYLGNND